MSEHISEQIHFTIDKKLFAAFLCELRKEKGLTQKELAAKLFISDKAISKWERALSLPDTALLIPLSKVLDVTVTELLKGERLKTDSQLNIQDVEKLVVNAIDISSQEIEEKTAQKIKWKKVYTICCLITLLEILLIWLYDMNIFNHLYTLLIGTGLFIMFGAYFCIFIKERLPKYYDENKISSYNDGMLRMNLPGVCFNNRNWPYIVRSGRVWICTAMVLQPIIILVVYLILPPELKAYTNFVMLPIVVGMFVPMIYSAYRYQ